MHQILAIDDDINVLKLLEKQLEKLGHRVIIADSGKAGVQMAKNGNPDLILCDIMMPEMDGHAVVKKLRRDDVTRKTPIIMLTSVSSQKDVAEAMRYGVVDYIVKPHNFKILATKIEAAIHYGQALKKKEIQERLKNISVSRDKGMTVLTFLANLDNTAMADELKKTFNSAFMNMIKNDALVIDIRALPDLSDNDILMLGKILGIIKVQTMNIITGRHFGALVEKADYEYSVNFFISYGDFELFINKK